MLSLAGVRLQPHPRGGAVNATHMRLEFAATVVESQAVASYMLFTSALFDGMGCVHPLTLHLPGRSRAVALAYGGAAVAASHAQPVPPPIPSLPPDAGTCFAMTALQGPTCRPTPGGGKGGQLCKAETQHGWSLAGSTPGVRGGSHPRGRPPSAGDAVEYVCSLSVAGGKPRCQTPSAVPSTLVRGDWCFEPTWSLQAATLCL